MFSALQQTVQRRFQLWLERRLPPQRTITLSQSKIFIFPSRAGLSFMSVLLVLLLIAINYQNNMIFALVFVLVSAFIVTILHTYANLSGLSITAVKGYPGYVGEKVAFELKLQRHTPKPYFDIAVSWPDSEVISVSLTDRTEQSVILHLPATQRGLLCPPRLLLETFYPLGLLRCWTWLALDTHALVYPRPLQGMLNSSSAVSGVENEAVVNRGLGNDDFYAFRDYQPGDPLKHLAWKAFAKGQSLQTKQYAAYQSQQHWLEWEAVEGDAERRLSVLCYWVLQMENLQRDYGLRLPGVEIPPALGDAHRDRVLERLALFQVS